MIYNGFLPAVAKRSAAVWKEYGSLCNKLQHAATVLKKGGSLYDCNMGWLRLGGSLKLQVSFAKEPYKRDYILPKRPIILRSLLIVATPQQSLHLM